jgi:uncharacterized protein
VTSRPAASPRRTTREQLRHPEHVIDEGQPGPPQITWCRCRGIAATCLTGTVLLGASFRARPGTRAFYGLTLGTAATWIAGTILGTPAHPRPVGDRTRQLDRPVIGPLLTGLGAFAVFRLGTQLTRHVPPLDRSVSEALAFAQKGSNPLVLLTTLANSIGEEIFFRGTLYGALPTTHPVAASTAVYTAVVAGTRNPALTLAASAMGTLFGYQRRATQGVQAPMLTHAIWSVLMVTRLPRAVGQSTGKSRGADDRLPPAPASRRRGAGDAAYP